MSWNVASSKLAVVLLLALAVTSCKRAKKEEVAAAVPPPAPVPVAPVGVNAGAFTIPRTVFARGEPINVTYNQPMTVPPGQQHWITVVKPTDVESAWGAWHYVKQGATTDTVKPPAAGEWEIRLHDVYPRWAARVMARQRITVQ